MAVWTKRRLIISALEDAIGWQHSLSDAYNHMPSEPACVEAQDMMKRYRALLELLRGDRRTSLERHLADATEISVFEIPKEPTP